SNHRLSLEASLLTPPLCCASQSNHQGDHAEEVEQLDRGETGGRSADRASPVHPVTQRGGAGLPSPPASAPPDRDSRLSIRAALALPSAYRRSAPPRSWSSPAESGRSTGLRRPRCRARSWI